MFSWGYSNNQTAELTVDEQVTALSSELRQFWEVPVVVRLLADHNHHGSETTTTYKLIDKVSLTSQDMYLFIAAQEHAEIFISGEPDALRHLTKFRKNAGLPLFSLIHGGLDVILVKCDDLKVSKKIANEVDPYVQFTLHKGGVKGDMGSSLSVEHHLSTVRSGTLDPQWGSTLCVTINRCMDLENKDADVGSRSDPYVVCTLLKDKETLATARTAVKPNTLDPEWKGEEGKLRLPTTGWCVGGNRRGRFDISTCMLLVEVFDEDPISPDLEGQVVLPLKDYVKHTAGSGKLTLALWNAQGTAVAKGEIKDGQRRDSKVELAIKWDQGGERFTFQPDRLAGRYLTMTVMDRNADTNEFIGKCHEPLDDLFLNSASLHRPDHAGYVTLRPKLQGRTGESGHMEVKLRWRTGLAALQYGLRGSVVTVPWKQSQLSVQSEVWSGVPHQEPFMQAASGGELAIEDGVVNPHAPRVVNRPLSDLYTNASCVGTTVGGKQTVKSEVAFRLVREWEEVTDHDDNLYEFWVRLDYNFTGGAIGLVGESFSTFDGNMCEDKDAYCITFDGCSYHGKEEEYEPTKDTVQYTEDKFKRDASHQMKYSVTDIENWSSSFKSGDLIVVNVEMSSRQREPDWGCKAVFYKKGQREPLAVIKNLPEVVYPAVSLWDGTGSSATFGVTKYRAPPGLVVGAIDQEFKFELQRRLKDFYEFFNPRPANSQLGQQWENNVKEVCECASYDEGIINAMLRREYGTDLRMFFLDPDDRELIFYASANKLVGFGLRGTYDVVYDSNATSQQLKKGLDSSMLSSQTSLARKGWKMYEVQEKVLVKNTSAAKVVKTRHPADRSSDPNNSEPYGQIAKLLTQRGFLTEPHTNNSFVCNRLRLQILRVDGLTHDLSTSAYSLIVKWCDQPQMKANPMQGSDGFKSLKWAEYFVDLSVQQIESTGMLGPLLSFELFVQDQHVGRAKVFFDGQTANEKIQLPNKQIVSVSNHESAMLRQHEIERKKKQLESRPGKRDDMGFVLDGDDLYFVDKQSDDQRPRLVYPAEDRWKLNDLNDTGLGWSGHPRPGAVPAKSFGLLEMLAAQHKMHTLQLSTGSSDRQRPAALTTITFKLSMKAENASER